MYGVSLWSTSWIPPSFARRAVCWLTAGQFFSASLQTEGAGSISPYGVPYGVPYSAAGEDKDNGPAPSLYSEKAILAQDVSWNLLRPLS